MNSLNPSNFVVVFRRNVKRHAVQFHHFKKRVMRSFKRLFGRSAQDQEQNLPLRDELSELRQSVVVTLHGCSDQTAQRLAQRVRIARSSQDLWVLRSDLYQCIAQTHSQTEAVKRINSLIEAFEGWIPPAQLKSI
jgi:hypothetical protein